MTTGLELWAGKPCAERSFRQRMWGTMNMPQAILSNARCWVEHMGLDQVDTPHYSDLTDGCAHSPITCLWFTFDCKLTLVPDIEAHLRLVSAKACAPIGQNALGGGCSLTIVGNPPGKEPCSSMIPPLLMILSSRTWHSIGCAACLAMHC